MAGVNKALLPYGTTSSAPAIVLPDTALFLSERGSLTKNYFENAVEQLNRQYDAIRNLAELNEMAFGASYNFVPRVGQTYHLYRKPDGQYLLTVFGRILPLYRFSTLFYSKGLTGRKNC
jgi:hypothetical protein